MNKKDIENNIKGLIQKLFGHEDLNRVQYFTLKDYLELFMAVEDHFKITIPLKSIKQLLSLDALIEDIHKKLAAKNNFNFYPAF